MKFSMKHLFMTSIPVEIFTDKNPPKWLSSEDTHPQPYGLAFALRYRYDECGVDTANQTEMGYNYIKPEFTGKGTSGDPSGFTTAEGELLSNYLENCAGGLETPANQIARGKWFNYG